MTRFILNSTGKIYIALDHTVGKDLVYGRIEKNGLPFGRLRNFNSKEIKYLKK